MALLEVLKRRKKRKTARLGQFSIKGRNRKENRIKNKWKKIK